MATFFSGWIGYGAAVQGGVLQEPADVAYARRPIVFAPLQNGMTFDVNSGTVGPSSAAWGTLSFAGLFDAMSGGNLLVVFPLSLPVVIGAGATYTTGPGTNLVSGCGTPADRATHLFPAGTMVGVTPDGRMLVANIPLQLNNGVLSAQSSTFGSTVTMATLPSQSPGAGSGQLWNNGGVISVS